MGGRPAPSNSNFRECPCQRTTLSQLAPSAWRAAGASNQMRSAQTLNGTSSTDLAQLLGRACDREQPLVDGKLRRRLATSDWLGAAVSEDL